MLIAQDVHARAGDTALLNGVSAAFAPGKVTIILGPNGAGKSTLLTLLSGLKLPSSGAITLDGQPLTALDDRDRARAIGLLPQAADVHWDIDVRTLVALGRFAHQGRWGEDEADRKAITAALTATDTAHFAQRAILSLSGGERARVLLARVLAGEPRWLLADEPLANLDPRHQAEMLAQMRNLAHHGVGVIAVLHDLNQAAAIADHIVLMEGGRCVAVGEPEAVLTPDRLRQVYRTPFTVATVADGRRLFISG